MANYLKVVGKKKMSREAIEQVFAQLNETHFKGLLTYPCHVSEPHDPKTYGPYVWQLHIGKQWMRVCWLTPRNRWRLSHGGGGGHFTWWVETLITHTIAKEFDGFIRDDADGEREEPAPEKYTTYSMYMDVLLAGASPDTRTNLKMLDQELCDPPKEFRIDFGEQANT